MSQIAYAPSLRNFEWEPVPLCPVCGSPPGDGEHTLLARDGIVRIRYVRCSNCFLDWQDPMLTDAGSAAFYAKYYDDYSGRDVLSPTEIRSSDGGLTLTLSGRQQLTMGILVMALEDCKRWLDFGCGPVGMLKLISAAYNVECYGVDPDKRIQEQAAETGIKVWGSLAEVEGKFDAIVSTHVLEHMRDPVGTLASLHELAVPNGKMFLQVPHRGWRDVHNLAFSPKALTTAVDKGGWRSRVVEHGPDGQWNTTIYDRRSNDITILARATHA